MYLILAIIGSVYIFKMVNILDRNKIPTFIIELSFSFNKFRKFIETCDDNDKKTEYTNLYKKARLLRKVSMLYFISLVVLMYILMVLKV
jgi:hypothetical protein